jgi:hypothetical protein
MEQEFKPLTRWAPMFGKWEFAEGRAIYIGPQAGQQTPFGLVIGEVQLTAGRITGRITLPTEAKKNSGRLVFGYSAVTRGYFSSGIHGYGFAYVLDEFMEARGWKALAAAGSEENTLPNSTHVVETGIKGQRVTMSVNGVQVIAHTLPRPLDGHQVGLFAWGPGPVEFTDIRVSSRKPEAFVVMQFGEPYDSLYTEVIKPVVQEFGLQALRVDEVYRPGIILQDIITGIAEAGVVIAEITPPNPNVFYELGYAHAMDKPTILLAERGKELPFDIKSYRCIFYDNTIRGKRDVEAGLRRHLSNILQEPG